MGDRDVQAFDARARHYESDWIGAKVHRPVQRATLDIAADLAPHPRRLLDVGCGTGQLLRTALERFPDSNGCGVDPADGMIRVAEQASAAEPRLRWYRASAEQLPFAAGEFDLVLSTNSFHNWVDHQAGLTEIGRVLAPDGLLVLVDPFAVGWLRGWARLVGKRARMRTDDEVGAMLARAGLRISDWRCVLASGRIPFIHAVSARRSA